MAAVLLVLAAALAGRPVAAKPQRIVSLNLCTDQLLLLLADRSRIASVTYLASDPAFSYMAEAAKGLPANRALAEDVVTLDPDLVLAGSFTTRNTVPLLRRLGFRVVVLDFPPKSLEAVRRHIRQVAAAVGEAARGERLIADMDARIRAQAPPAAGRRPSAVIYSENGFTVGRDSLIDDIVRAAGFDNLAAGLGLQGFAHVALESLVMNLPDLMIFGGSDAAHPSLARQVLHHPALEAALARDGSGRRRARTAMPTRLWTCGGPFAAEAVERLARARARLVGAGGNR